MNKTLLIIFCIFLPIFLVLFSYKIVLGFTDLTANQEETVDFLKDKEELRLNYTNSEVSHLEDVKKVMNLMDYLFYFSLLMVTGIITYYKRNKKRLLKLFKYGGIVTVLFIIIKSLFALISFNYAFTIFHQILFPQGNWTFPFDSLLIQTFPLEFFIEINLKILGLAFIMGSIFIGLAFYFNNVHRSKRN